MPLSEADQDLKNIAIQQAKVEFISLAIELAGDLKDVFYNCQNLLVKWFQEGGADGFTEENFKQLAVDQPDLVAFMTTIQGISTTAQDPANQWVSIVSALARARKL